MPNSAASTAVPMKIRRRNFALSIPTIRDPSALSPQALAARPDTVKRRYAHRASPLTMASAMTRIPARCTWKSRTDSACPGQIAGAPHTSVPNHALATPSSTRESPKV